MKSREHLTSKYVYSSYSLRHLPTRPENKEDAENLGTETARLESVGFSPVPRQSFGMILGLDGESYRS